MASNGLEFIACRVRCYDPARVRYCNAASNQGDSKPRAVSPTPARRGCPTPRHRDRQGRRSRPSRDPDHRRCDTPARRAIPRAAGRLR